MHLELARPTIPVYSASKRRTVEATLAQIRYLADNDRIARMVKRKDGKLIRVYLKAKRGECCSRPIAEDNTTTKHDLPGTYSHHAQRSAAYGPARAQLAHESSKAIDAKFVVVSGGDLSGKPSYGLKKRGALEC